MDKSDWLIMFSKILKSHFIKPLKSVVVDYKLRHSAPVHTIHYSILERDN